MNNITISFIDESIDFVTSHSMNSIPNFDSIFKYIIDYLKNGRSEEDLIIELSDLEKMSIIQLYMEINRLNYIKKIINYKRRSFKKYTKNGKVRSIIFPDKIKDVYDVYSFLEIDIYKNDKIIKTHNFIFFLDYDGKKECIVDHHNISDIIMNHVDFDNHIYYSDEYDIYFKKRGEYIDC